MKRNRQFIQKIKDQRGITAIVVAVMITVLMGFVGFAVDVGYVAATRNQLQNAADAAALAGAGLLGQIYLNMNTVQMQSYDCSAQNIWDSSRTDKESIELQAQDVVGGESGKNRAGGSDIEIPSVDILIGKWDGNPITVPNYVSPDAVTVTVRRDNTTGGNGPITTFFAKLLGWKTASLKADATAALTGPSVAGPGEMNLPIGLSIWQFFKNCDMDQPNTGPDGICSETITFSPTTDSCAGWHNFFDPINANAEAEKLINIVDGNVCEEDCNGEASPWPGPFEPKNGHEWLEQRFDIAENKLPVGTQTPTTTTNESMYFFQGGTISSLFLGGWLMWNDPGTRVSPMIDLATGRQMVDGNSAKPAPFPALFDYFRFRDGDGDDTIWTAAAPVYADECPCSNPNEALTILGFAAVKVRMPNPPPDSTLTASVNCTFQVIEGRGGGGTYGGLKGSIPTLVE